MGKYILGIMKNLKIKNYLYPKQIAVLEKRDLNFEIPADPDQLLTIVELVLDGKFTLSDEEKCEIKIIYANCSTIEYEALILGAAILVVVACFSGVSVHCPMDVLINPISIINNATELIIEKACDLINYHQKGGCEWLLKN